MWWGPTRPERPRVRVCRAGHHVVTVQTRIAGRTASLTSRRRRRPYRRGASADELCRHLQQPAKLTDRSGASPSTPAPITKERVGPPTLAACGAQGMSLSTTTSRRLPASSDVRRKVKPRSKQACGSVDIGGAQCTCPHRIFVRSCQTKNTQPEFFIGQTNRGSSLNQTTATHYSLNKILFIHPAYRTRFSVRATVYF